MVRRGCNGGCRRGNRNRGDALNLIWVLASLLIGAGPWMLSNVAPLLSNFLSSVALIFGLSALVHILLVLPTALVHKLLVRITGVDVA